MSKSWRSGLAALVGVALLALAVGCGGDGGAATGASDQELAEARADAAREARLEERVRQLEAERNRARRARERAAPVRTVTEVVPVPAASASAPRSTPAAATAASSGHIAQLGSFTDRANAERRAADLRARGIAASVLRSDAYVEMASGYWVTYAGFYATSGAADAAVAQARAAGISDAFARYVTAVG